MPTPLSSKNRWEQMIALAFISAVKRPSWRKLKKLCRSPYRKNINKCERNWRSGGAVLGQRPFNGTSACLSDLPGPC